MGGTVCLTFDFDAVSIWIQKGFTTPTSISRGEFGVVAVPRILHMLEKRDIKSTWFIPGHTIETYPDVCKRIVDAGHEISLHGYTHENFNSLTPEEEWEIIERSYDVIKQLTGSAPKGFRSPAWDVSTRTIEFLEKKGILYDSSQMGHDYALYYSRNGDLVSSDGPVKFGEASKVIEIPVSWSLDDYPYFEYFKTPNGIVAGLQNPNHVFDNWMGDVEYMLRDFEDGVLVATMHPQVSGRGHRLLGLERWIDRLMERGLQFSRMDRIAEKFAAGYTFGKYNPK